MVKPKLRSAQICCTTIYNKSITSGHVEMLWTCATMCHLVTWTNCVLTFFVYNGDRNYTVHYKPACYIELHHEPALWEARLNASKENMELVCLEQVQQLSSSSESCYMLRTVNMPWHFANWHFADCRNRSYSSVLIQKLPAQWPVVVSIKISFILVSLVILLVVYSLQHVGLLMGNWIFLQFRRDLAIS